MGYYTWFSLEYEGMNNPEFEQEVTQALSEISGLEPEFIVEMDGQDLSWHHHERDMIELSKKFPEVCFFLYGSGDDSEDLWYKYFLNGKIQRDDAQIVFDGFDPSKLEDFEK